MKRTAMVLGVFVAGLCASVGAAWQTGATQTSSAGKESSATKKPGQASTRGYPVMISADVDCTFSIDAGAAQSLTANKPLALKLEPGEHLLVATSVDGKDRSSQVVNIDKPTQKVVLISLLTVKQAREREERAKKELEEARAEESKDNVTKQAMAVKQQEQREKQHQQEVERRQAAEEKQRRISDLRSQISGLQDQIAEDEQQADEDARNVQRAEEDCSQLRLQPGVLCVAQMTANASREDEQRQRREANELRSQIRDLEMQINQTSMAPAMPLKEVTSSKSAAVSSRQVPVSGNTASKNDDQNMDDFFKQVFGDSKTKATTSVELVNGWVSDSICGVKGARDGAAECTKKCLKNGANTVMVTDDNHKIFTVDNPDSLKGYEGHHIAVSGHVNGDSIHVISAKSF